MSSRNKRDECQLTSDEASKGSTTTPKPEKPEFPPCSGSSMAGAYVLAMWCPVFRRHDSYSGFRTELENLFGDAKGKGTSGGPARLNVPMRRPGSDCSIVVMKRSNVRGAKGAGHPSRDRVNWKQEELTVLAEGGNFHWVARAV